MHWVVVAPVGSGWVEVPGALVEAVSGAPVGVLDSVVAPVRLEVRLTLTKIGTRTHACTHSEKHTYTRTHSHTNPSTQDLAPAPTVGAAWVVAVVSGEAAWVAVAVEAVHSVQPWAEAEGGSGAGSAD